MDRTGIAARLRQARELAGITQAQAARLLGLSRPSISEAEAGNRRIAAEELAQLARLYEISADWVLYGGDPVAAADMPLLIAAREASRLSEDDLEKFKTLLSILTFGRK